MNFFNTRRKASQKRGDTLKTRCTNIHGRPAAYQTNELFYTYLDSLELEDLLLGVTKILQDTSELTLVLGADLGTRDSLVHGRRTADEDLDVLLLGLRQNSLQQLLGDEALATSPLSRGLVQDVEGTEALGVGVLQIVQLLLQKNVFLSHVTEDQSNLGLIFGVLEDLTGKLVHRGDTSATGDQADVVVLVGLPGVLDNGALEGEALVDVHRVDVLRHGTAGVGLDDKLKVAGDICDMSANESCIMLNVNSYPHHWWECKDGGRSSRHRQA